MEFSYKQMKLKFGENNRKKTWNSISNNKKKLYYRVHLTCILSLVYVLRLLSSQQLI